MKRKDVRFDRDHVRVFVIVRFVLGPCVFPSGLSVCAWVVCLPVGKVALGFLCSFPVLWHDRDCVRVSVIVRFVLGLCVFPSEK